LSQGASGSGDGQDGRPGGGQGGQGGYQGSQRTATYPMSRLSAPHDLVETAREIAAAGQVLGAAVGSELEAIAEQIRALQAQAHAALERARRDAELHRARCRFRKRPGEVYHLYRDGEGQPYFSMLSPDDWAGRQPHAFEGSYRLEADMRYTPLDEVEAHDRRRAQLRPSLDGALGRDLLSAGRPSKDGC